MRYLVVFLFLVLLSAPGVGAFTLLNVKQWTVEEGGNGHWYGVLAEGLYYQEAADVAAGLTRCGYAGHLATVTSHLENQYIFENIVNGVVNPSIIDQYWMGGVLYDDGWSWITGEEFAYTNWNEGEPNNSGGNEDRVGMWGAYITGDYQSSPETRVAGYWNDEDPNSYSYWALVEWGDPSTAINDPWNPGQQQEPIPEPSSLLLFALGGAGLAAWRYRRAAR